MGEHRVANKAQWIERLRREHKDDKFAQPMLTLIKREMLVVDKKERSGADLVCCAIRKIVHEQGQTDALLDGSLPDQGPRIDREPQVGTNEVRETLTNTLP